MGKFIEPLILYVVLFFRVSAGYPALAEGAVPFSLFNEIARIVLYNIPSLALIWYLLLKSKSLPEYGVTIPGKRDFLPAVLALPSLVLIGLSINLVSRYFTSIPASPRFLPPRTSISWIVLGFSCLSTAYLEESFFRFYLLSKRKEMELSPYLAILVSVALFSLCHIYEGPWGFLNAALSGFVLAFVFFRYRSLHGIAFAHAAYNLLVYILNTK